MRKCALVLSFAHALLHIPVFRLIRFKILEGQLYVHFAKTLASQMEDHDHRALFAVAMLLEVLQEFPGQIADTDAVFHTTDWPCHAQQQSSADTLPPILGYSTTDTHVDIPMPDFTELSHFGGVTNDPKTGKPRIGWEQQLEVFQTFEPKTQQLFWRGRHDRKEARDYLRNELIDCPKVLSADTQHDLVSMLNLDGAAVSVYDRCQYQYLAYVESKAYSASLKHMLACGSVVLSLPLQYHHYYAQALAPDEHLVHVQRFNNSLCLGIVQVLRELQADPQRVERIGKNALQVHLDLSQSLHYCLHHCLLQDFTFIWQKSIWLCLLQRYGTLMSYAYPQTCH